MLGVVKISAREVKAKIDLGVSFRFVCAYDDPGRFNRFRKHRPQGSLSLREFKILLPSLEKSEEIIFYCN